MIRDHAEDRPLVDWLITQEKVLQLWIDEAVSNASSSTEFVERLELHRAWLSAQIDDLVGQRQAA